MTVFSWPEIESFHNIRKYAHAHPEILKGHAALSYRAKVKLHGTNAGVQVYSDGRVVAQSRTQELVDGADNAGFARWVAEQKSRWASLIDVVVFGEWCGSGIQKGVAISGIGKRVFAVFAVRLMASDELIVDPDMISAYLPDLSDTHVLPWFGEPIVVDWTASADSLSSVVEAINKDVHDVEENDPWVEKTFGVKGTGEGLVYYPAFDVRSPSLLLEDFSNLVFKAKGEKHKNIKTAAAAQVDASVVEGADAFADLVLTEARLEQGAAAVGASYDPKLIGKFLAWVAADVQKETQDELQASGLSWKQVEKAVYGKARGWYIAKTRVL